MCYLVTHCFCSVYGLMEPYCVHFNYGLKFLDQQCGSNKTKSTKLSPICSARILAAVGCGSTLDTGNGNIRKSFMDHVAN